jgi:hypothetical protein
MVDAAVAGEVTTRKIEIFIGLLIFVGYFTSRQKKSNFRQLG